MDLISYTVTRLGERPSVTEASPGSGDVCGATFINRTFEDYLVNKLGALTEFDNELKVFAMEKFEDDIKPRFRANSGEQYRIKMRGVPDNRRAGTRTAGSRYQAPP